MNLFRLVVKDVSRMTKTERNPIMSSHVRWLFLVYCMSLESATSRNDNPVILKIQTASLNRDQLLRLEVHSFLSQRLEPFSQCG